MIVLMLLGSLAVIAGTSIGLQIKSWWNNTMYDKVVLLDKFEDGAFRVVDEQFVDEKEETLEHDDETYTLPESASMLNDYRNNTYFIDKSSGSVISLKDGGDSGISPDMIDDLISESFMANVVKNFGKSSDIGNTMLFIVLVAGIGLGWILNQLIQTLVL